MCMIGQNEFQMIVNVRLVLAHHSQSVAMFELKLHSVWINDSRCHRQVVHKKMNEILVSYTLRYFR